MASSNVIVLNSKFNPFSYQELLAPIQSADTEHKFIQEEEGKLKTLADAWKNRLNPEIDKKAYEQYSNYLNNLKAQSEALSKNGLTPTSRKSLIEARASYNSDILPIEQAWTTRKERADEQRKLSLTDPNYIHEKDLGTVSLDEFISNPNISSRGISGSYFTKAVADAAEQMSKELRTDEGRDKWKSILGRQYFEKIDKYGFSSKEVLDAINGNPKAAAELTKLVKNAVDSSGILDWNNPQAVRRAYEYANQGLYHAIGTSQSKQLQDNSLEMALKRAQLKSMDTPPQTGLTWEFSGATPSIDKNNVIKELSEYSGFMDKLFSMDKSELGKFINSPVKAKMRESEYGELLGTRGNLTGGTTRMVDTYPNKEMFGKLVAKYGTNNIYKLRDAIQRDVEKSSWIDKSTNIKLNDNTLLSGFINNQLLVGKTDKEIKKMIKPVDDNTGKELDRETASKLIAKESRIGYRPYDNKLTLYNPALGTYEISKDAVKNIDMRSIKTGKLINGTDYINEMNDMFENNDPNLTIAIDNFYNNLDVYGRTGKPAPSSTDSKASL